MKKAAQGNLPCAAFFIWLLIDYVMLFKHPHEQKSDDQSRQSL
jgi:hypothetical protein